MYNLSTLRSKKLFVKVLQSKKLRGIKHRKKDNMFYSERAKLARKMFGKSLLHERFFKAKGKEIWKVRGKVELSFKI